MRPKPGSRREGPSGVGRLLPLLLPVALVLAGPALLLARVEPVEALENVVFDAYQRLSPRAYEDAPVRVLDIDDETLARLGQWPWPRTVLARIVTRLRDFGAAAIAFDAVFPEPDRTSPRQIVPLWSAGGRSESLAALERQLPDHDRVFAGALAASPSVLGVHLADAANGALPQVKSSFVFPSGDVAPSFETFAGAVVNRPELERAARGVGSFTYRPDRDGIIRRVPIVERVGEAPVPSLAAEALRLAQGADTILVKCGAARADDGCPVEKIRIGSLTLPTDDHGRLWLRLTGSAPERTIPLWRIFEKGFEPGALAGRIVFVGTSAAGLRDQRATPLNPVTPGVEIHAQVVEQALLGRFLARPAWAVDAEALAMGLLGALLVLVLQRFGAAWGGLFAAAGALGCAGAGWRSYTADGLLLDPLLPALTLAATYLSFATVNFVQGEREKREIRNAFRHSLSPHLVDQLARHPETLKLGGEMRRMTFHTCDIAGFASLSEFYDPFGLIRFLNGFLSPLTEVVLEHRGTIDKYIGDRIVAFWNAPLDDADHARNACLAALAMHERLDELNERRRLEAQSAGGEFVPIRMRTGLHTGNGIVGNMGSSQRFSYSAIGDEVNLASRLEGANKFFGTRLLASETTVREARDAVETRPLGRVRVPGKVVPVKVFELLARKGALSAEWRRALPSYERGLDEFARRDFARACDSFREVLELFPEDGPAALYLKLASDYAVQPPPEDWDGVLQIAER